MSAKKILLFGFIFILLLVIPLTVYLLQKQQETRSKAAAATRLYFSPSTIQNTSVNQKVSFDIYIDPGTNQISFAKLTISYDDKKFTADNNSLQINQTGNKLANVFEGTTLTPSTDASSAATISITLSVGADPTAVIQTVTKIATITLTAKDITDQTGTKIQFVGSQTQVLSIGTSDQANENVLLLSSLTPATVVIAASTAVAPTSTPTPTATPSAGSLPSINQPPVCSSLSLDRSSTGIAPYSIAFTAIGSDSNGTINKVTFNFGDGPTRDVTTGGGIGAASVQTQIAHTFRNSGTFRVTAVLADNNGAVSNPNTCTQTITVNAGTEIAQTAGATSAAQLQVITAPPPSLPPTGPSKNIVITGIVGGLLSIIGALLLFSL